VKVHTDKIEKGPPHALSIRDVRLIFKTVPPDWTKEIKEVRIANPLGGRTFFSRFDGCLTIYSRKVTTEEALRTLLSELAAISLRLDRGLRRRPKAEQDRLSKMIAPLMLTLSPRVRSKSDKQKHVSLEGFHELHFAPFPNDSERK